MLIWEPHFIDCICTLCVYFVHHGHRCCSLFMTITFQLVNQYSWLQHYSSICLLYISFVTFFLYVFLLLYVSSFVSLSCAWLSYFFLAKPFFPSIQNKILFVLGSTFFHCTISMYTTPQKKKTNSKQIRVFNFSSLLDTCAWCAHAMRMISFQLKSHANWSNWK